MRWAPSPPQLSPALSRSFSKKPSRPPPRGHFSAGLSWGTPEPSSMLRTSVAGSGRLGECRTTRDNPVDQPPIGDLFLYNDKGSDLTSTIQPLADSTAALFFPLPIERPYVQKV